MPDKSWECLRFAPKVVEKVKCEADTDSLIEEIAQVWREMAVQKQAADEAADRLACEASVEENQAKKLKEAREKKSEARRKAVEQSERKPLILAKDIIEQQKLEENREQLKLAEELARAESIKRAKKKAADMAKDSCKQLEERSRSDDDDDTNIPNSPRPSISSMASRSSSRSSRSIVSSVRLPLSFARKARASSRNRLRVQ